MFSTLETEKDTTYTNSTNWECVLRRNTAAGSTSGLQIFFKKFPMSERLINASIITGQPAVRVRKKRLNYVTQLLPNSIYVYKYSMIDNRWL